MSTIGGADSAAAETVSGAANKTPSWRDHLPIHPAADLFPLMSESELRELGEDIKANGLQSSIVVHCEDVRWGAFKLLDGRNRLDAMELVGIDFKIKKKKRQRGGPELYLELDGDVGGWLTCNGKAATHLVVLDNRAVLDFVISANVHRRHLTAEQKRELIAKILKAKPEASNRKIAKQTKADHKTVAAVRGDLESTGEIPQLEKTTGADGKQRKLRAKKSGWPSDLDPATVGDACLVAALEAERAGEISVEQRKAEHAALDDPIEEGCADCNTSQEDVADPATVEDNALYTLGRMSEHARVFKKIFKLSTFDREAEIRIGTAIERMIQKWRSTQATLTKRSHENVQGDIVEQCLSLIVAMNKEQRAQFFAKYTELSAARAPARPERVTTNSANAAD